VLSVDDVIVNKLATDNSYTVYANTTNNVPAPGVLGDDTGINGTNLTASLSAVATNGSVTLSPSGGFSYVPNSNYIGADTFTYDASDGTANLGTGSGQPDGDFFEYCSDFAGADQSDHRGVDHYHRHQYRHRQ